MTITYHCDDCGKQVKDHCEDHPSARVSSVAGEWPRIKYAPAETTERYHARYRNSKGELIELGGRTVQDIARQMPDVTHPDSPGVWVRVYDARSTLKGYALSPLCWSVA